MLCASHACPFFVILFFPDLLFADRTYRKSNFDPHPEDRPLIVQFCGHDPALLLASAKFVEKDCDAIDLNLVRWENMERKKS